MKNEILARLNEPAELEKLYRSDKATFKREFSSLYPEVKGNLLADAWFERLNVESDEINWGTNQEKLFVLAAALVAGLIAKIPSIFQVNEEFFYPRNIGFIFLPLLTVYFAWKNNLQPRKVAVVGAMMLLSLIYINVLPDANQSDTLILACIHLPLLLWLVLGRAFVGNKIRDNSKWLDFLRFNGDLIVMTTLILLAGGIMTGLTLGLFSVIGLQIKVFYFQYIAVFGLASAPIVGTYLIQSNPQLVSKVSPVIAKIFGPLVLVMLIVYLLAIFFSGQDPYRDREFLILFNLLLAGVMAIIFFSVAENTKTAENNFTSWVLFLLSAVTVVVNGIALSAIIYRTSEWGVTPNRLAVMGSNALMLLNLLFITNRLREALFKKSDQESVEKSIVAFLPAYAVWVLVVVFLFPLIFSFE